MSTHPKKRPRLAEPTTLGQTAAEPTTPGQIAVSMRPATKLDTPAPRLPVEIWLQIVLRLDTPQDIVALASVNTEMRWIMAERPTWLTIICKRYGVKVGDEHASTFDVRSLLRALDEREQCVEHMARDSDSSPYASLELESASLDVDISFSYIGTIAPRIRIRLFASDEEVLFRSKQIVVAAYGLRLDFPDWRRRAGSATHDLSESLVVFINDSLVQQFCNGHRIVMNALIELSGVCVTPYGAFWPSEMSRCMEAYVLGLYEVARC
eukprot:TRINITY_DN31784_c0_g1_i2.p1 TRINITY_DN31784_c0_g1~~TRINITY_DN31784_c0_g1_i2.p1  ORF type:complete len:266 (+),score=17.21 TRINITY_DN31784_c0_g1_i2:258-1055(+)